MVRVGVAVISSHAPARGAKGGSPPFAVEIMLRIHFVQPWSGLSRLAVEETLLETALY